MKLTYNLAVLALVGAIQVEKKTGFVDEGDEIIGLGQKKNTTALVDDEDAVENGLSKIHKGALSLDILNGLTQTHTVNSPLDG